MKYYGIIGFAHTIETSPGIWEEQIVERPYYGDVNKYGRRLSSSGGINDNVEITNTISVISDPFAIENMYSMRYITWMGKKWKVSSVNVEFPRLELTIGDLYNEETT